MRINCFAQHSLARLLTLTILALLMVTGSVHATTASKTGQIKVAMLFNILKFVTWPDAVSAEATTDITIGLLGSSELIKLAPMLDNERIGQRKIKILPLSPGQALPEHLDAICLGTKDTLTMEPIIAFSTRHAILTVSDRSDFVNSSGMIGLTLDGSRVKFDINLDAAFAARIGISSKLASLARMVIENGKAWVFR